MRQIEIDGSSFNLSNQSIGCTERKAEQHMHCAVKITYFMLLLSCSVFNMACVSVINNAKEPCKSCQG